MKKITIFIAVFSILGLFLISNSFAGVKTYEEYVTSLEKGYEPVPRECFEQAMKEGQLNIYDWAAWWDEDLYNDFSKIFGIKIMSRNRLESLRLYLQHRPLLNTLRLPFKCRT